MSDETKPRQPWTPGPWTLGNENNYSCEVCLSVGDSELVISLGRHDTLTGRECVISREEMLSNARLVISAPAIARALARFVIGYDDALRRRGDRVRPDDPPVIAAARSELDLCGWRWS